jgi:hypothetical protein
LHDYTNDVTVSTEPLFVEYEANTQLVAGLEFLRSKEAHLVLTVSVFLWILSKQRTSLGRTVRALSKELIIILVLFSLPSQE